MDLLTTMLVSGVLFGIISAVLAAPRGRSPVAWFVIGALLGIIGLILVVVLPSRADDRDQPIS